MFMVNEKLFNTAMLRLITRADLEPHLIGKCIVAALLRNDCMKFGDLHQTVCEQISSWPNRRVPLIDEKVFRQHIKFVNEKFRLINNLDLKHSITIAHIYDITVEVEEKLFTRIALVHNIREGE
jgi:hypothetical protein